VKCRLIMLAAKGERHVIELICIGCGCDDEHACTDEGTWLPCSWTRQDPLAGVGVCSVCPASVEARFDAGDRDLSESAAEHRAELSAEVEAGLDDDGGLILPGDYAYDETLEEMRRR
jgi:hypothetical protein